MENIKRSDADIPPETRENLYAEWTKFRDWLEADGMTGCIASYRAGYIAAWEHQSAELDKMKAQRDKAMAILETRKCSDVADCDECLKIEKLAKEIAEGE